MSECTDLVARRAKLTDARRKTEFVGEKRSPEAMLSSEGFVFEGAISRLFLRPE